MSRLDLIVRQISTTRQYTCSLLEDLGADDWFRQPSEGVTHIAWQVGHLAAAEYFLALERIRGRRPDDAGLIPEEFLALFGRGSVPHTDPTKYPNPTGIRLVFDRIHEQAVGELTVLSEEVLDQPTDKPHPMFSTKMGALLFCPQHEMLHAGQIGLLRRLFGNVPLR